MTVDEDYESEGHADEELFLGEDEDEGEELVEEVDDGLGDDMLPDLCPDCGGEDGLHDVLCPSFEDEDGDAFEDDFRDEDELE